RGRLQDALSPPPLKHPETEIVLFEPYERDLQLFDTSLMTYGLRREVIRRGFRTTVKTILADLERYTAVFARHGIRLVPREEMERKARRWSSTAPRRVACPSRATAGGHRRPTDSRPQRWRRHEVGRRSALSRLLRARVRGQPRRRDGSRAGEELPRPDADRR